MRWKGRRQSDNIEDRRGRGGKVAVGGGLGTILIIIIFVLLGGDPQSLVNQTGLDAPSARTGAPDPANDELAGFVAVVLADTEDVWNQQFAEAGKKYSPPRLVLFRGQTQSGCGFASAATGPFYCPGDQKVYLDLEFFDELARRFDAPGDFAQAYVIAHEIGHHVQHLLGITDMVHQKRETLSEADYNQYQVRLELQADFLAGVWAHHANRTKQILEEGDAEEALRSAAAIGDDTIQKRSQGYVVPDSFTHGTSEQRVRWFLKGLRTGDLEQGDTFSASDL